MKRIMGYIESGKQNGAVVHLGGERHGTEGYFIQPTIFTNTKPEMKIVQEEIFGPVGVVIKFDDEEGQCPSRLVYCCPIGAAGC
jgi:aldehyde dehydrogenase (NAD+)